VEKVSLAKVIAEAEHVDLLKIDVEGRNTTSFSTASRPFSTASTGSFSSTTPPVQRMRH
jgi:hypothetical protein